MLTYTLFGPPRTKKNSQQIQRNAAGRPFVATSKAFADYERSYIARIKTPYRPVSAAVRAWAGSPQDFVSLMGRSYADLSQYIKPGFVRAVETAQPDARLPALSPASPCLDAPRVDRAQPSGNDFLADAAIRPRRHKRKE